MKAFIPDSSLFQGISQEEIQQILICLSASHRQYKKGAYILHAGDTLTCVGLVLSGSVEILQEDYWGRRQILDTVTAGQLFGESYACAIGEPLMVSVAASADTCVLFLDVERILTTCPSSCSFHNRLIRNLLSILSEKNLMLTRKIGHISKRTIRERVLSYLSFQAGRQGNTTFEIPFDRQQLADYLAVDRSALSSELSKMQQDHLISYKKNRFTLCG